MSTNIKVLLTSFAFSALALAPVAGVSVSALALSAQSGFAQGKGHSSGNGHGNSTRGSNGASNGNSHRATAASVTHGNSNGHAPAAEDTQPVLVTATAESELESELNGRGALASELKGLNAAHANPNAFLHANPNSNVGKIGTYYFASLDQAETLDALTEAGLSPDDVLPEDIADQATLDAQLAALDPTSPDYDQLAAVILLSDLGYSGLETIDPAAPDYDAQYQAMLDDLTSQAISDLTTQRLYAQYFESQGGTESALAALLADGQTLSPEALAEFNRLLGL